MGNQSAQASSRGTEIKRTTHPRRTTLIWIELYRLDMRAGQNACQGMRHLMETNCKTLRQHRGYKAPAGTASTYQ